MAKKSAVEKRGGGKGLMGGESWVVVVRTGAAERRVESEGWGGWRMVEPPGPTVSQGLLLSVGGSVVEREGWVEESEGRSGAGFATGAGPEENWRRSAWRASARPGLEEMRVERTAVSRVPSGEVSEGGGRDMIEARESRGREKKGRW